MDVHRRAWLPCRVGLLSTLGAVVVGGAPAVVFALSRGPVLGTVLAGLAAAVLTALPLLWIRVSPFSALLALGPVSGLLYALAALLWAGGALSWTTDRAVVTAVAVTTLAAAFPAGYAFARHRDEPVLAALVVVLAPFMSMATYYAWLGGTSTSALVVGGALWAFGYVLVLAPAWAVGTAQRRRARRVAERARRNAERAEHAVRAERTRVMRELQGLVLADLASIERQAERAHRVLGTDHVDLAARADARAALASLTATGRDSLTAMRRLLGMLRGAEAGGSRSPQPTLDRIDELVAAHRRSGLDVRLTVSGERRVLPDDVDLAAYRLVQRVLADSRSGTPVRLQLSYADRAVRLVARGDVGDGCGVAVREWVRMVGGEVSVDEDAPGVEVWLPTRGRVAA